MRIGVVGVGYWGTKALREYLALRDEGQVDEVHVCDATAAALAAAKKHGRLDGATSSLPTLFKNVDAIHVATPNHQHFDVAQAALEKGKHVLLEKPMTTSAKTSYDLVELASHHGLVLKAGHIYRFNNAIRALVELVKKNHFGPVYYYKFQWTDRTASPPNLDILWDLLPHPLDMVHFMQGEWPETFTGTSGAYRRKSPSEVAFVQARYPKGRLAAMELSWLRPIRSRTLEIVGAKRDALVDCVAQKILIVEDDVQTPYPVEANNTLRDEATNFLDSIKHGKNPFNSAVLGARNVEAVESAIRSLT